jgi:hypothetical protein
MRAGIVAGAMQRVKAASKGSGLFGLFFRYKSFRHVFRRSHFSSIILFVNHDLFFIAHFLSIATLRQFPERLS